MTSLATLIQGYEHKYGIAERVNFEIREGAGFVRLSGDGGTALVAFQGAQVMSWRHDQFGEMLWWSPISPIVPGRPARGGIPICWPWFGPHPDDAGRMHGTVRTQVWDVIASGVDAGAACAVLSLNVPEGKVTLIVRAGAELEVLLTSENKGAAPLMITEALHTYFAAGDVGQVSIEGLDGCGYRDRTANDAPKMQHGSLAIAAETNAHFDVTPDDLAIVDASRGRTVAVRRLGGASTVVWNPGDAAKAVADIAPGGERGFICVESGNVGQRAIAVAPGAMHTLGVRYAVTAG